MARSSVFRVMGCLSMLVGGVASAQQVAFKDPTGDDNGPGKYKYPTDLVYKPGSFDLTGLSLRKAGDKLNVELSINSAMEDPWKMGAGFSVQMAFIFIDTDGKEGSGHTDSLPGLNVAFEPASAWEKVIILSPQGVGRVKAEASSKAGAMKDAVVVPTGTKASGRKIMASIPLKELGEGDFTKWGYQVVMQSNEGFPAATDLLTRKVNEYEGQHRFGGGTDTDCDPHAMDVLAGAGKGDKSEIEAQHKLLAYECNDDGSSKKRATLSMVRAQ